MKLLVVATIIAVTTAARLEHLERGYLPPDSNNFGNNGLGSNTGSFGNGFNTGINTLGNGLNPGSWNKGRGPNGFGLNGQNSNGNGQTTFGSNGLGGSQGTNGFGSNGVSGSQGTNGFGSSGVSGPQGTNGFGSNGGTNGFAGATSNQYLPPDQTSSGSGTGLTFGGSPIMRPCTFCGVSRFTQQYNQAPSAPGTSFGVPQLGSSLDPNAGSNSGATSGTSGSTFGSSSPTDSNSGSSFGSPNGNFGSNSFGSQGAFGAQDSANRQYLAPRPSFQNPPQQPFDEQYGYIY